MMLTIRQCLSWVMIAGMFGCLGPAWAGSGPNTALPFADDFEGYPNLTPLTGGTNGWYASSVEAMVQNGVVHAGAQAAQVPIDVTLSNQFSAVPVTNLWIEMMVRPVFYDGGDTVPEVDPNATAMFHLSSNGYLVVHHGSPIGATNWLVITNRPNGSTNGTVFTSNAWIQLHLFQDFTNKTCFLFANGLPFFRAYSPVAFPPFQEDAP